MKRFSIISVMLAILLALGLMFSSCGDGDGSNSGGSGYSGGNSVSEPGRVYGLSLTANSTTSVRVSWTELSEAESYQISYYPRGTANEQIVTAYGSPRTIFDLTPGTEYVFDIRAYNSRGYGPWSREFITMGGGSGTGTGSGSDTATVMIFNESSYYSLYATLNRGLDVIKSGTAYSNSTLTWTGVPTGVSLWISSADSYGDIFETGTFTLTSGQTKTFTYDGFSLK